MAKIKVHHPFYLTGKDGKPELVSPGKATVDDAFLKTQWAKDLEKDGWIEVPSSEVDGQSSKSKGKK